MGVSVVILAAGVGSRMHSPLPKPLLLLGGIPMLYHCLDCASKLITAKDRVYLVVGQAEEEIRQSLEGSDFKGNLTFVRQEQALGSGHALKCAVDLIDDKETLVVLYADAPLIEPDTLKEMIRLTHADAVAPSAVWLTAKIQDPTGYGRIIRDASGNANAIVEEKDCTDPQRSINEINTGFMAANTGRLRSCLQEVIDQGANNAQGEYLLTDVMKVMHTQGHCVKTLLCAHPDEFAGANDMWQLAQLEKSLQKKRIRFLALAGTYFLQADTVSILGRHNSLRVGKNVKIGASVIFSGDVRLGDNVEIGSNCLIKNSSVEKDSCVLDFCHVENAKIGQICSIGPFARIRPDSDIRDCARVGNFVEIKKSVIDKGSKVNHLAYIGDAVVGQNTNIGAGTITCNYDGIAKHQTVIKDNVFIGSNSSLVAPITIGKGAMVGAGSVISKDVAAGGLALERSRQREIKNYSTIRKKNENER